MQLFHCSRSYSAFVASCIDTDSVYCNYTKEVKAMHTARELRQKWQCGDSFVFCHCLGQDRDSHPFKEMM